mgnify:CR=1 FL=1
MESNEQHPAPRALIITGYGLNCENETACAFRQVGAEVDLVHLKDLLSGMTRLESYHILAFIGGFSFGDHLGAGTVFANRLKYRMEDKLRTFVDEGGLVIGICNGFQTLTRLGLVPQFAGELFRQRVALAENEQGVFRDAWVRVGADDKSPCVFTRDVDTVSLPIRHAFLWDDGVMYDLGVHNDFYDYTFIPSFPFSEGVAINDNGEVAGSSITINDHHRGFFLSPVFP